MPESQNLKLPMLEAGQAQKHVTVNEALRLLDAVVQLAVATVATAPPPSPAEGARHIVGSGATGVWSGHDDEIALRRDGAWTFVTPQPGFIAFNEAAGRLLFYDAGWVDLFAASALDHIARVGIATAADAVNRLAIRAPAVLHTAVYAAEGGSGDAQWKLNKEDAAGTASLVFQSGYAGRAEIGLAGDDRLHVKQSNDGATWHEALVIEAGGRVRAPRKPIVHAMLTGGAAALSAGVAAVVPFDTALLDATGDFSTVHGRFTCPVAGRYRIEAVLLVDNSTPSGTFIGGFAWKNGANALPGGARAGFFYQALPGVFQQFAVSAIVACAAGDTLEIAVEATAASAIFGGDVTRLAIDYLG